MKPLNLSRPHLIIMIGIPSAGKSFFADHFAETFKAPIINVGNIRQDLENADDEIIAKVADLMLHELFKTNQTIVYEGFSESRAARQTLAQQASAAGYVPLFVWVQTESAEAGRREAKKSTLPAEIAARQFEEAVRRFSVPVASEKAVVISGKHTYTSQLKIVLKHLSGARTAPPIAAPAARSTPHRNIFIR